MAIISILAGMLLPALGKAMDKARTLNCANNLKQIHLGLSMYLGDSRETYPWLATPDGSGGVAYWWFEAVDGNLVHGGTMSGYIFDKALWLCPSDDRTWWDFRPNQLSYGINYRRLGYYNFAASSAAVVTRASQIRQPSATLEVADSRITRAINLNRVGVEPTACWTWNIGRRHNNGSNIVFADGHTYWNTFEVIDTSDWWGLE